MRMRMKDDYLWDRTGEPDATVQELEDVLSTLRYEPQPLALPPEVKPESRWWFFPSVAIAAAIALIVLGLGIWLRLPRQQSSATGEAAKNESKPIEVVTPSPQQGKRVDETQSHNAFEPKHRRLPANDNRLSRNPNRGRVAPQRQEMTAEERAQAEAARDQLMLALRVVSAKLNLAQRKAVPATGNTRFQHKVG